MAFEWLFKKKTRAQTVADFERSVSNRILLPVSDEEQLARLKARLAQKDEKLRLKALQEENSVLKAMNASSRKREAAGDDTATWIEQGCPTQSAVTIMKPLTLTSKNRFGMVQL